jgi:iron complex transport system substrate-binding protein
MNAYLPNRIICLTEETTETIYMLGEQDRIVGISGFTVRPPEARKEKPKVSAFTSAKIDKILDLKPDLVLGFSDLQADIAAELIRSGIDVYIFNQRSVAGILQMITTVGSLVGQSNKACAWVASIETKISRLKKSTPDSKPVIYFEEWDEPNISGIQWVAELIEIAGGIDCFPELSNESLAKDRIIAEPMEVVKRNPDIIVGSWCGKKFRPDHVAARPHWNEIKAVQNQQLHEIKSPNILQPGPAALTDGLDQLCEIIDQWQIDHTNQPHRTLKKKDSSPFSIRIFMERDSDAVIQLWQECQLTVPWNDPQKDIQRKLNKDSALFLIGEINGEVVASLMGGYDGHRGWINYLAVAPKHQKNGYAKKLIAYFEHQLAQQGCPKINLQIRDTNIEVQKFYQSLGYETEKSVSMGKRLITDN